MKVLFFLSLLTSFSALAKTVDYYGVMPNLSVTKKLTPKYDLNVQHYDHYIFTDREYRGRKHDQGFVLGYFLVSGIYKIRPNINLTLGYVYQRQNPLENYFTDENALFQQITYAQSFREYRLSHRLRLEERLVNNRKHTDFRTRVRYQTGFQFPLSGVKLDAGEYYLNSYNEIFFSTSGERNAFLSEDRVYVGLGYKTENLGQLELGPLSQMSVYNLDHDWRYLGLLQVSWIYSF